MRRGGLTSPLECNQRRVTLKCDSSEVVEADGCRHKLLQPRLAPYLTSRPVSTFPFFHLSISLGGLSPSFNPTLISYSHHSAQWIMTASWLMLLLNRHACTYLLKLFTNRTSGVVLLHLQEWMFSLNLTHWSHTYLKSWATFKKSFLFLPRYPAKLTLWLNLTLFSKPSCYQKSHWAILPMMQTCLRANWQP